MLPTQPEVPAVGATEVPDLIDDGALLIDVREQDEWAESRIPGATLRPMSQINTWYTDLPTDQKVIVYCRSGSRSGQVVRALIEQAGFEDVVNLSGGIVAWDHYGLDIEDTPAQ